MWSPVHGGISDEITLTVVSLVAMVVPLVCGFLAGSAIYRWPPRPQGQRNDRFDSSGLPPLRMLYEAFRQILRHPTVYRRGMPHPRAVSLQPQYSPHAWTAAANLKSYRFPMAAFGSFERRWEEGSIGARREISVITSVGFDDAAS